MNKHKVVNWSVFILLSFIWGSSFILMKISSTALNGWQIASIRLTSAGLIFLPLAVIHLFKIPKNKLLPVAVSGILGNLLPAFLFAIAIDKKVDSSLAGILNSLTPLLVILLGVLFFRTKISAPKITGVLIGFTGLLILSLSKGGITMNNFWFAFLILLATFCYALNVHLVSHYLKGIDPLKMATVSLGFMMLPALFFIWQQGVFGIATEKDNYWPIGAAMLLGIAGSAIATVFFYALIKRAGGLFASLVTYGIPVVAILWGIWDKENITGIQLGCLGLILGGVYLANRS
jgi:drug/metabolite transporter (DMT)-like permease